MGFDGYLLKLGDYIVPTDKYVKYDTYKPYVNMQDIDPWSDGDGYLHRNAVELKALKVEFETPPLTNITFEIFMSEIRANYINPSERSLMIEAYIPELNEYVSQLGYLADFQPTVRSLLDGTLYYDQIKFSFVGGVAND